MPSLIVKIFCEKYFYLGDNFKAWELKCLCCDFEVIQLSKTQPVLIDSVKKGVVSYSTQFGDLTSSFVYLLWSCLRSEQ